MSLTLLFLGVILFSRGGNCYHDSLAGHQIWKLEGHKSDVPSRLMVEGLLDVLDHSRHLRHVRVAPQHAEKVRGILQKEGLSYQVLVNDLAGHLEDVEKRERARRDTSESCTESSCPKPLTKEYMTFEQMELYLKELNKTHFPNVTLSSIGKSHENRDIWLIHIKSDNASAKTVWIEGGIHAREWISPAVAHGLIPKIINDENMRKRYDFFVAPMANPDGYQYTWDKDRMWRKNRRKNDKKGCDGVDLNRNWDFKYGVGASSYQCSEVYKGLFAFSEPETKALKDSMLKVKDNLKMVLSLHSYGQDLLYPWGWTNTEDAPNKAELIKIGNIFSERAKESSGHKYSVVNSAGGLYYASGATDDWSLGVLGSKYTYTLELRDDGHQGFTLSADEIEGTIEEVWVGFKKTLDTIT